MAEQAGSDQDSVFSSSALGVKISHYRLITQAAPGFVALLLIAQSEIMPVALRLPDAKPSWEQVVAIGIPLVVLSLPAGFVLSGISFFTLGILVFPIRDLMCHSSVGRPVRWLLKITVGSPKPLRKGQEKAAWVEYVNSVGHVLREFKFRGPREDAPDKVLAVAIFARSCCLLCILIWLFRATNNDHSTLELADHGIMAVVTVAFLLFASFFEFYRDVATAVAADYIQAYPGELAALKSAAGCITKAKQQLLGAETPESPESPG